MRKNYTKTRAVLLAVILMLGALASTVSASDTIIPQCELSQHADPFDDYVVLIVVTYEIETNQPRVLYYNPCTLIGTSEDPIRDGLNYYTYAVNNPIMYFDPFGLSEIFVALRQWFDERMGWSWVSGGSLAWDDKSKTATVTIFQGSSSVTRSYTDGVNGTYIGQNDRMYVNAASLNSAFASVTREPSLVYTPNKDTAVIAGTIVFGAGIVKAVTDVGKKIENLAPVQNNVAQSSGNSSTPIRMNLGFFGKNGRTVRGTPRNNQAQNSQTRDVANRFNLSDEGSRLLHDEITGRNFGYQEILEIARDIARLGGKYVRN